MTNEEFEREFDILYNNIMSNAAPSIDKYEKSVFLTKAQEEIVTAIYDGSFEHTEKTTECLDKLVTTKEFDSDAAEDVPAEEKISTNSKVFKLDTPAMFITYEALLLKNKDACGNAVTVLVKPTRQDEYYRISRNPFRRARKNEALRLNIDEGLEIVSVYSDYIYKVRYIRKPRPIVLYTEPGLTVDGVDVYTECELDPVIHRLILDRAVQLAVIAYKNTATN